MGIRCSVVVILLLASHGTAWSDDVFTQRFSFEGLACGEERSEVFVRVLAAARELGYETSRVDPEGGVFQGDLKTAARRMRLEVTVSCSGVVGDPLMEKFHGPAKVEVVAELRAKRGGMAAARAEADRLAAAVNARMEVRQNPAACLGFSGSEVASLDGATRSAVSTTSGMLVSEVDFEGPAAAAGLEPWDVVLGVDGRETPDSGRMRQFLIDHEPGDRVTLLVQRGESPFRAPAVLGRRAEGDGSCLAVDPVPVPTPAAAPRLSISSLAMGEVTVAPSPVPPGQEFDVTFVVEAFDATVDIDTVDVTLVVAILRNGEVLYTARPETLTCNNGPATTVVKHLRASRQMGSYELRLTAVAGSLSDQRTVAFEIR